MNWSKKLKMNISSTLFQYNNCFIEIVLLKQLIFNISFQFVLFQSINIDSNYLDKLTSYWFKDYFVIFFFFVRNNNLQNSYQHILMIKQVYKILKAYLNCI